MVRDACVVQVHREKKMVDRLWGLMTKATEVGWDRCWIYMVESRVCHDIA